AFALPPGRSLFLRLQEWHDLAAGDQATITLAIASPSGVVTRVLLRTYTKAGNAPALTLDATDETAVVAPVLPALTDPLIDPNNTGALTAWLELEFQSSANPPGRGWFLDDVELVLR